MATSKKSVFKMYRDKAKATTKPVKSVDDLKGLWDRTFGTYRVVVVEVYDRKGSLLDFDIVLDPATAKRKTKGGGRQRRAAAPYTIDLDDGANVWGDLPSTAQLVDPNSDERIAYLCINENWLYENLPDTTVMGGGGGAGPKIPSIVSL